MAATLPSYDIVVATRNRPEALALSLPLILAQVPLPERLIVIDASDDHATAVETIASVLAASAARPGVARLQVEVRHTAPGSARQRNLGLALCRAPIVILPDDDSLFYPDTAAQMLSVYAADADEAIAAVCAGPEDRPPPTARMAGGGPAYAAATPSRLQLGLAIARQRVADRMAFANPFVHVGSRLNAAHRCPEWLADAGVVPVPYMTGYRMSFRRAVLDRTGGFDDALIRYAWFEDVEASLAAMAHGLVVCATRARIHHHRFPGARADGRALGLWSMLNRAYVVMKHVHRHPGLFPSPSREAWRLRLALLLRLLATVPGARRAQGRARLSGSLTGFARLGPLLAAPPETLGACYRRLRGTGEADPLAALSEDEDAVGGDEGEPEPPRRGPG